MRIINFIIIILLITLTFGCSGNKEEKNIRTVTEYERVDDFTRKEIIEKVNNSKEMIYLSKENYEMSNGNDYVIPFLIRNNHNTSQCFYTQAKCKTTLKSFDCNEASFLQNTDYYWKWFNAPQKIFVKANESIVVQAFANPEGERDTYLAEFVIWRADSIKDKCYDYDKFAPMNGMEIYTKKEFKIDLE